MAFTRELKFIRNKGFFSVPTTEKGKKKVNDFRRTHAKNRPSFGLTSCNKARVFFPHASIQQEIVVL